MRQAPGFLSSLQQSLESLSFDELERINRDGGLEVADLLEMILKPRDHSVYRPDEVDDDVVDVFSDDKNLSEIGLESFAKGETAFCILAGGAGTRIGASKARLRIPGTDMTLLDLKLSQAAHVKHVWIMTSPTCHDEISQSVKDDRVLCFPQYESVRLTVDNQLHLVDGRPDFHPCGHGDLVPALTHSGILGKFLSDGGKHIAVVNVDNVSAGPSHAVLGRHITKESAVTCEVVEKNEGERGGVLCDYEGFNQIVETFRLVHAHPDEFKWMNTNSMIFAADLPFDTMRHSWHRVKKNVNGQLLVQYERLLQDLTATFKTNFVRVNREDRFRPVKNAEDLQNVASLFARMLP